MKRIVIILALQFLTTVAGAHKDRILSLSPTGSIPELPTEYVATKVQLEFSEGRQSKLIKLIFSSASDQTVIPECLLRLVQSRKLNQISLTGSWYHNETILPHYVHIKFADADKKSTPIEESGLHFLFNLRNAQLIEVEQVQPIPNERAVRYQKIELENGCPRKSSRAS